MRKGLALPLALLLLAAAPALAQQPPRPDLAKGLFGGREPEPGDEEEAAGRAEPAPATPTAPPTARSTEAYDARVKQSFAAAESFRGKLDGAWTINARGVDLLRLQLTDRGDGRVEGAWRDLRRPGALDASGFLDQVVLSGTELDMRFKAGGGADVRIDLEARSDGRWTGKLSRADQVVDVVLLRAP